MFEKVLFCSLFSLLTYTITIVIKKFFKNYIPARYQYLLWIGFFCSLLIAFFPYSILKNYESIILSNQITNNLVDTSTNTLMPNTNLLNDMSISVQRFNIDGMLSFLNIVWLIGITFGLITLIMSYIKLILELRNKSNQNLDLQIHLNQLKDNFHIFRKVDIFVINKHLSPYSFGFFNPRIVLPIKLVNTLSQEELDYILFHELIHIKNKDGLLNILIYILKIVYWFNPLIWLANKHFRFERELLCDSKVLSHIGSDERVAYGEALLNCFSILKNKSSLIVNDFSSLKGNIINRITNIANHKNACLSDKLKTTLCILIVLVMVFVQVPFINVYANNNSNYVDKVYPKEIIDLSNIFKGYKGAFVLYDSNKDNYLIYNETLSRTRFAPNSTYKIIDALMHLEYNTISIDDNYIEWDDVKQPFDVWNQGQTLKTALWNSVNWYFQTIDQHIDKKSIAEFLSHMNYGNENITSSINSYWLESTLKISPIEQVNVLRNLDSNLYGLDKKNVEYIKESLLIQESDLFKIYGKTGTGNVNGKLVNGWFIGSIQLQDNKLYFATYIKDGKNAGGKKAANITYDVLRLLEKEGYI
uniref:BlaR1 family beta-lactam sensor/signal transducer n=1 Tax=Thomasclavelia ramosa TaxID=1547 RepID=UPI00402A7FB6